MYRPVVRCLLLIISSFLFANECHAQIDIFGLMQRRDLNLNQIKAAADSHFTRVGTGQGTGYKQFQRWLYEREFHLDGSGNFIDPEAEYQALKSFRRSKLSTRGASQVWKELGPTSWTYTSSWNPGLGRITSVAVFPSDTTLVFVSSPGGGIWRSWNSGQSWKPLTDFINTTIMDVFHLCIDPNNQSTIYASTASAVYKSTDTGNIWTVSGSGPSGVKQVKIHPQNSTIVFAAAGNGLWRSTNSGSTWTKVETAAKEDIEFNPADPQIMYASNSSGTCVWRSTNNGQTWTAITASNGITSTGRTLLAVSPHNPAKVYAVQASGSVFGKFYVSTDTGKTYTTLITGSSTAGTNFFGYTSNGTGTTGQASYDMAICVNPSNSNEIHIAGIICWKSTNGGTSFSVETEWTYPNSTGYNHADVHALEWIGKTIYSGSDGGVFKSMNNGDDWSNLSSGLGIRQLYRISCSKTDTNVITSGAQDNGSAYRKPSGSWVEWLGADGMDNAISPTNASIAIGTSQNGSIYRTTNAGNNYTNLTKPSSGNWVTPIVMHPTNHDTVYGGWTGVWRSANNGSSWTNLSPSITVALDVLAVAPSNPKYIYASDGNTLYRTTNGGITWSSSTAPASISSIYVSEKKPHKIWISCNSNTNRVFVSNDTGVTYTNLSSGLPSLNARSVVVHEDWNETIYVGMNIGVYYKDTSMSAWLEHGTGLPLVAINEVEIQKSGKKLRVATYGRGIWESPLQNIPELCPKPLNLTSFALTTSSASVKWKKAIGANTYVLEYKKISDGAWTTVSNSLTDTFYNFSALPSETQYLWRVRSNCNSSNSIFDTSNFTTLILCDSPFMLSVSNVTKSSASLLWRKAAGANSYRLEYKKATDAVWTTANASLSDTFFSLTGLSSSTNYVWRVKSNCNSTTSGYSEDQLTTANNCSQPNGLTVDSIKQQTVVLRWRKNSSSLSYRVEYKRQIDPSWTTFTPSTTDTSAVLTGLIEGTLYDWRVRSHCVNDSSIFEVSNFKTESQCLLPLGLTETLITNSSTQVSWKKVQNASSYRLENKLFSNSTWTLINANLVDTFYNLNGLTPSSKYEWRVRTNCGSDSSGSSSSSYTTLSSCDSPSKLTVDSISSKSGLLKWSKVIGALFYQVEYKTKVASNWSLLSNSLSDTFVYFGSLNPNTDYDWRVKTICNSQSSLFSISNMKTLESCPPPLNLLAKLMPNNSIELSWSSIFNALTYTVEYKLNTSSTWISVGSTTNLKVTISALQGGLYDWRVKSNCQVESSDWTLSKFSVYCDIQNLSNDSTFIDLVRIGKINRESTFDGGYIEIANPTSRIKPGSTHTVVLSPGFEGPSKTSFWTVAIDYNQDGDFLDSKEIIGQFSYQEQKEYPLSFLVPSTAKLGKTRMRVALSSKTKYPATCGTIISGEVEDYVLEISSIGDPTLLRINESTRFNTKIYPNPIDRKLKVMFNGHSSNMEIGLKIFDLEGRLVFQTNKTVYQGENELELDLETLNEGSYFLHLETETNSEVLKFLIDRN